MSDDAVLTRNSDHAIDTEGDAAAALEPGHLLEKDGNGDLKPHSTDAGAEGVRPLFAGLPFDPSLEKGETVPSGERVRGYYVVPGVGVDALLAVGETVDPTTPLVSAGDGTLRAFDSGGGDDPDAIVAYPEESADSTGEGSPIRVEIEVVN